MLSEGELLAPVGTLMTKLAYFLIMRVKIRMRVVSFSRRANVSSRFGSRTIFLWFSSRRDVSCMHAVHA